MNAFFIAGNFWLFAALTLAMGAKVARTQPVMYSFFGVGGWYYPFTYNLWIAACLAFAFLCLAAGFAAWRRDWRNE